MSVDINAPVSVEALRAAHEASEMAYEGTSIHLFPPDCSAFNYFGRESWRAAMAAGVEAAVPPTHASKVAAAMFNAEKGDSIFTWSVTCLQAYGLSPSVQLPDSAQATLRLKIDAFMAAARVVIAAVQVPADG